MGAEEYLERVATQPDLHDFTPRRMYLVPADAWLDPSRVREDDLARLGQLLPGIPEQALGMLKDLSDALTDRGGAAEPEVSVDGAAARGRALLDAAEGTVTLGRVLEGLQVDLLADLATTAAHELLVREHGVTDPGELSRTKRARWRARAKSVVAQEFAAVSGFGIQDCHDRVGFALAPVTAREPARRALQEGRSDWWQVWQWWKRCRPMDPDTAADVAGEVFAAHPSGPLSRRSFMELLDREATRAEGQDPVAARAARAAAVERRRLRAVVDADGIGCLSLTGRTSTVVAAADRIDAIARRARAAGDSRTLDQLRSDAALALLTCGTLPVPPEADSDDPGSPGDPDRLDPAAGGGWDPAAVDRLTTALAGHAPATVEVVVPYDVLTGANPDGVALLTGHGHLGGEHAREVALTPGSTFYRLVTDPATGTLIDRSVDGYAPDAEMRALVSAADRYCRAPGCTIPARASELDHVTPYPAGSTTVSNLAALHSAHHGVKTNTWWSALFDPASREITWTSFYDRRFRSLPFDYRVLAPARGAPDPPADHPTDRRDQLVYAALAHREPGDTLGSDDELDPGADLWAPRSRTLTLTHTSKNGKTVPGAPPHQRTPTELVGEDAHASPDAPAPTSDDDEPPPF